jgi:hypothetical protein
MTWRVTCVRLWRETEFNATMNVRGKKLRTFHHKCRKDWENALFRPCQISERGIIDDEESLHIQSHAVASNGYKIDKDIELGMVAGHGRYCL